MSNPEIAALEEAHRAAQARLGLIAGTLSMLEWAGVNPADPVGTAARWTEVTLRIIAASRRKSRRLAIAYYRLARALDIGTTVPAPDGKGGKVSLEALRKEMTDALLDIGGLDSEKGLYDNDDEDFFEGLARDLIPGTPVADISIDEQIQNLLDAMGPDGKAIGIDAGFEWEPMVLQGDALERIYKGLLDALVLDHQKNKRGKVPTDLTPQETLDWLQAGHEKTGVIAAGIVDQASIDAGRDTISSGMRRDSKTRVVCRGTSADPCHFCAMLASRGWDFISAATAVNRSKEAQDRARAKGASEEDIEKYHPHCHCYPIVRWVDTPDLPESNAYFNKMWPLVVAKYPGKDAINAWRNWMNAGQPPIE